MLGCDSCGGGCEPVRDACGNIVTPPIRYVPPAPRNPWLAPALIVGGLWLLGKVAK